MALVNKQDTIRLVSTSQKFDNIDVKRAAVPIIVLLLLVALTSYKLGQILPSAGAWTHVISVLLFCAMLSWQFLCRKRPEVFEKPWFQVIAWMGSLTMGLWGTFILISLPFDLIRFALASTGTENFLGNDGSIILITTIGINILGLAQTLRGPKIKTVKIEVQDLSPDLEDLRITQLSDLHIGPTIRRRYVNNVVRLVNETKPDIVVVTGDLADADAKTIKEHMQPLSNIQSKYGMFYVTGNHEYYWGAKALISAMSELGFTPLLNENRILSIKSANILLAGVTDPAGTGFYAEHRPDLTMALKTDAVFDFKMLLCHRPGVSAEAEPLGVQLQLSGHTHAGQFFPFNLLIPLAHRYYRGLNQHGRLLVYVNPGTGYWGPANRFAIPAEVTSLRLTRAQGSAAHKAATHTATHKAADKAAALQNHS